MEFSTEDDIIIITICDSSSFRKKGNQTGRPSNGGIGCRGDRLIGGRSGGDRSNGNFSEGDRSFVGERLDGDDRSNEDRLSINGLSIE